MASASKRKGAVKTVEWWKHLRNRKRAQNKLVRKDGKTYFIEVTKYRKEKIYVNHAENKEEALRSAMDMVAESGDGYMDFYSYDAKIKHIDEKDVAGTINTVRDN